jgi:hypothetical protein
MLKAKSDKPHMNPSLLQPNSIESFFFTSNKTVEIPKVNLTFDKWTGNQFEDTYNNKPVLNFEDEPVFAELAILRIFQSEGWNGVWVDTYRRKYRNGYWDENSVVQLPQDKQLSLNNIYKIAGIKSGCWDVFCWKDEEVIFAESKRRMKDKIRANQIQWLEAAFKYGLKEDSFLMVEWDLAEEETK